jgi:hypothetical protein
VISPRTFSGSDRSTTDARVTSWRANSLTTSRSVLSPKTFRSRSPEAGIMTSRAKNTSSGSVEYSRVRWRPRRATFSVSTDRFRIRRDTR